MAQSKSAEARTGWLLVTPPALYAMLLLAAPLATVLIYSVLTGDKGTVSLPVTGENYATILEKPIYGAILWRSLYISMLVTLITVVLAYPVA